MPYISSVECGCNLVQTFDRMMYDSLAEWNANGGSQTEAEQAGRQAGVWAAESSQAWQAQAHRVKAGKCNYHDDSCARVTRGKWTALRIVDTWNAKRRRSASVVRKEGGGRSSNPAETAARVRHWGSDGQGPPKTAHVTRHGPGTTKRLNPRGPRAVWAENFCCFACLLLLPNDQSGTIRVFNAAPSAGWK